MTLTGTRNAMNRLRVTTTVFCILFFIFLSRTSGDENRQQDPAAVEAAATPPSRLEMLKLMFSLSSSYPAPTTSYLNKVKAMINRGQAYFFPPNIEERKEVEVDGGVGGGGGGGAGEKVKEAAVKSFGTVEDSVESAARAAGDAVHKTAKKVKRTLSGDKRVSDEPEL